MSSAPVDLNASCAQVSYVKGYGKLAPEGKVEVKQEDGSTVTLSAKNTIIATGSCVASLPGIEIDEERCVCSPLCFMSSVVEVNQKKQRILPCAVVRLRNVHDAALASAARCHPCFRETPCF